MMTLLTTATIRQVALPDGTRLLGGAEGLSRRVSWSATLRTRAPGFQSLKGGEFLLIATTVLHALDPSLNLGRVLQSVEPIGVAGVAVRGPVDPEAVAFANDHDLPLFALPENASLADIEASIARAISEARSEIHRRAHEVYTQLTQLGIEGRSLAAIGDELQRVSGQAASLFDAIPTPAVLSRLLPAGTMPTPAGGVMGAITTEIEAWLHRVPVAPAHAPVEYFPVSARLGFLIAPLLSRGQLVGCVALVGHRDELDDLHREAVRGAAAAAAIVIARTEAVLDAEERAQMDALTEVVGGNSPLTDGLRRRAARLGIDVDACSVVVVSTFSGPTPRSALGEAFQRDVEHLIPGTKAGLVDGKIVLICPGDGDAPGQSLEPLRQLLQRRSGDAASIGVGRPGGGIEGLRRSYRDALDALVLGQQVFGPGQAVCYANLGLYRLLLDMREQSDVDEYHREVLGDLIAADTKGGGELIRTLEAFFASNCSPTEASTRLHIHRNTLLYRLQRIHAITKLDLNDPEVRLTLQVALRIHQIRRATGAARGVSPPRIATLVNSSVDGSRERPAPRGTPDVLAVGDR